MLKQKRAMAGNPKKRTPMMEQYDAVRQQLPDNCLLLFRLGDFYEMFDDDAQEGARLLGITLTQRNGQPMAGIPYHAADGYIQKVLRAGRKVAICEQVEAPKPGQLVKRSLTRILSPGTALEDTQIETASNRFIVACDMVGARACAAWLDITTGDFELTQTTDSLGLLNTLNRLRPTELVLADGALSGWRQAQAGYAAGIGQLAERIVSSEVPDYYFDVRDGDAAVRKLLGVANLNGFGIEPGHVALGAAGALLRYVTDHLCSAPCNIRRIREYVEHGHLQVDSATVRNLEIFRSAAGAREGSLLAAMDATVTAPGRRLLEQWLAAPPLVRATVEARHHCVGEFLSTPAVASEVLEQLKGVRDLPRILGRLRNRIRNPREAAAVRDSLQVIPTVRAAVEAVGSPILEQLAARIEPFSALRSMLEAALAQDIPNQVGEPGIIADGYDAELDRLRGLTRDSQAWLSAFEAGEIQRTGIRTLRVKYNGAFGYFIEVTKANIGAVPDDYIRRQTMTNAERYTTAELKEKEKEILHAEEMAVAREGELFRELVAAILAEADALEETAQVLAEIDVYAGWAKLARTWNYSKPELEDGLGLEILAGRHPVVEQQMRANQLKGLPGEHTFVANDTQLDAAAAQISILTGPNMAGKSTYIRQVALIVLMAQVGSWVPAERARIGMVDRIFSRVGASDELARGNSTFMVEMNETANILNNATERSLIILDEIGRGTSTYDGLSIAWAVVEHLHGQGDCGPRTLFATHYHELTQVARALPRVRNHSVTVKEWGDRIIFVRTVQEGAADRSYGIQVARLAGLPPTVIERAKVLLALLESDDSSHNLLRKQLKRGKNEPVPPQLELF